MKGMQMKLDTGNPVKFFFFCEVSIWYPLTVLSGEVVFAIASVGQTVEWKGRNDMEAYGTIGYGKGLL
jgi:hypothetical protein